MSNIESISITLTSSSSLYASTASSAYSDQLTDPFSDPNGPFANLNLTADQQTQIQKLLSQNSSSGSQTQTPTQLFDQIESVLTPQQQATLKTDLETSSAHHHHHHHGGSSTDASNLLSQLDLTSDQQSQVSQILQAAQTNGTASSDVLSQIDNVLTPDQQKQLTSLFASYTSSGSAAQTTPSVSIDTNA